MTATPSGDPTHRMLAVVVRHANQAWFLKGVGPVDQINDSLRKQFVQLIESIKFSEDRGQPSWDLPEGWQQTAGSGMRFANLKAGSVEFSVISLPFPGDDEQRYLLSNIIRWRGQLQLPAGSADELANDLQEIKLADDQHAILVDLRGWAGASNMQAPFAGGNGNLPPNHPPIGTSSEAGASGAAGTSPESQSAGGLTYDTPEGWHAAKAGGMRRAAFQVSDGDQKVEITIIDLAGTAGELLANVNRWRQQVGLDPLGSVTEIDSKTIKVGDKPATYLQITGKEGQAIWAAVVPDDQRVWFVKLAGDLPLAEREEPAFRSLLKSIQFGD